MNIAFFFEIFYPQINGVMTATFNVARNLKKMGHKVLYVVPRSKKYTNRFTDDGIEVITLASLPTNLYDGLRATYPFSKKLVEKLRREKIDIVHFTGPFTGALNAIHCGKALGIPVAQTFHTLIDESGYLQYLFGKKLSSFISRKIVWRYLNYYHKHSDIITAPSRYVINQMSKYCPFKKAIYISNGIDIECFKQFDSFEKLKSDYPGYNKQSFIYVGRLGREKSIDVIIRALAEVYKKNSNIKLFIIGHGPDENNLKALTEEFKLTKNVFFTGKIGNKVLIKKGFLQYARAFVTASKTENQPMTILEAIACGAPLILPYEKGVNELLHENGLFFKTDNHTELAKKMLLLSGNDMLYKQFKKKSLELSFSYDGKLLAKKFEQIYLKAVNKKKQKIFNRNN